MNKSTSKQERTAKRNKTHSFIPQFVPQHLPSIDVDKAALSNHLNAAQESARVLALAQYDIDSATTPEALTLARVHLNDAIAHARVLFGMALDGAVISQSSLAPEATRSTL